VGKLPKQQEQEDAFPSKGLFRLPHNIVQQIKERISTSSKNLDYLLGGGLEVGEITQFYGGPGSGKTHLCHTLCATLAQRYQAVYIDTESGFREDKIKLIADERGADLKQLSLNIHLAQPKNCSEQEDCIEDASRLLSKPGLSTKLLILDSLMYHYRIEYPGRSGLAHRAHRLNILMSKLRTLAQTKNIAVLITNQCSAKEGYDDPRPFGGNIISHASTYIIYFKRTSTTTRFPNITATSVKNPLMGNETRRLIATNSGFYDLENRPILP